MLTDLSLTCTQSIGPTRPVSRRELILTRADMSAKVGNVSNVSNVINVSNQATMATQVHCHNMFFFRRTSMSSSIQISRSFYESCIAAGISLHRNCAALDHVPTSAVWSHLPLPLFCSIPCRRSAFRGLRWTTVRLLDIIC